MKSYVISHTKIFQEGWSVGISGVISWLQPVPQQIKYMSHPTWSAFASATDISRGSEWLPSNSLPLLFLPLCPFVSTDGVIPTQKLSWFHFMGANVASTITNSVCFHLEITCGLGWSYRGPARYTSFHQRYGWLWASAPRADMASQQPGSNTTPTITPCVHLIEICDTGRPRYTL